jgi:O-antigen/teichoic acid export membrane protein
MSEPAEDRLPLHRRPFSRAVAQIAGGTALSQLLVMALTPLLTRLYTPHQFGVVAAFLSILLIARSLAALSLDQSIPLARTPDEAASVAVAAVAVLLLTTGLTAVLCLSRHTLVLAVPRLGGIEEVIWWLPVAVLTTGFYQILNLWVLRDRAFRIIAQTNVAQGVGRGITQIVLGIAAFGSLGLVIGEIVGYSAGFGRLGRHIWSRSRQSLKTVSIPTVVEAAVRRGRFVAYMTPAALLNTAGAQLPAILLAACYGPEVAGWYFMTQRLLGIPVTLVTASVRQVFFAEACTLAREDPLTLKTKFNRIARILFAAGIGPALVLAAAGRPLLSFFLGASWATAGTYLQILVVSVLLKFSCDSIIQLEVLNRQDLALLWSIIRVLLVVLAVIGGSSMGLSGTQAIALLSAALSVSYLIDMAFWHRAMAKHIRQWMQVPALGPDTMLATGTDP